MNDDFSGKKILVTGGTGCIGSRLVEKIHRKYETTIRVLVRDLSRAPRIARLPVEIVSGDVVSKPDVERAMEGCDLVFHCAYGNRGDREFRRRVTVEGARNVVEAASEAGVERLVHVSTLSVYGHPPDGDLDETAPKRHSDSDYANRKLEAEKTVFRLSRKLGLPFVVVQPTVVYGPDAPSWTVYILNQLRSGRVVLVNGGDGLCNAVYIDDVVNALVLAGSEERALGEAFLISADEPITWSKFFWGFEGILGIQRTVIMTADQARHYSKEVRRRQSLSRQLFRLLYERPQLLGSVLKSRGFDVLSSLARPSMKELARTFVENLSGGKRNSDRFGDASTEPWIHPWDSWAIRRFESKVRVRIDKAKRLLGYRPAFTFETGIELTGQWARWARLVGDEGSLKEGMQGSIFGPHDSSLGHVALAARRS